MINCVPSSSPAMPALPGISPPVSVPPAAAPTNPADGLVAAQASPGTFLQTSFASALQSRLKLIAMNGPTANSPAVIAALGQQENLPELPIQFGQSAELQAVLTLKESALPEAKNTAIAEEEPSKIMAEIGASTNVALAPPAAADPTSLAPLALNVINPLAQSNLRLPPTAPTATATGKPPLVPEVATGPANNDPGATAAQPVATAILAAIPEKTVQATANQDSQTKTGDTTFTDALHSALPQQTISNPVQAQAAVVREVASPVASSHWASDIGNQLVWMTDRRESRAELVLNPPQLGRIEVSITLNGDQASASFVSPNPEVRDALQGSLPRLREVLADAGVFLGQANVGAESFKQGGNGAEKGGKSPDDSFSLATRSLLGFDEGSLSIATGQITSRGRGLIDLFA